MLHVNYSKFLAPHLFLSVPWVLGAVSTTLTKRKAAIQFYEFRNVTLITVANIESPTCQHAQLFSKMAIQIRVGPHSGPSWTTHIEKMGVFVAYLLFAPSSFITLKLITACVTVQTSTTNCTGMSVSTLQDGRRLWKSKCLLLLTCTYCTQINIGIILQSIAVLFSTRVFLYVKLFT